MSMDGGTTQEGLWLSTAEGPRGERPGAAGLGGKAENGKDPVSEKT